MRDVPFEPLELRRHAVEPPGQRSLQADRRHPATDARRARSPPRAPAARVCARRSRRACRRDPAAGGRCAWCACGSQSHVVGRIERDLAGDGADLALQRRGGAGRRRPRRLRAARIPALACAAPGRSLRAREVPAHAECRHCRDRRLRRSATRRSIPAQSLACCGGAHRGGAGDRVRPSARAWAAAGCAPAIAGSS